MAFIELPTFNDPANFRYTIELDGVVFELSFIFNTRDSHWYVDILDADGNQLRSGVKLVTGMALLRKWSDRARPPGELFMIDPSNQDREATLETIGQEVFLNYVEQSSISSLPTS